MAKLSKNYFTLAFWGNWWWENKIPSFPEQREPSSICRAFLPSSMSCHPIWTNLWWSSQYGLSYEGLPDESCSTGSNMGRRFHSIRPMSMTPYVERRVALTLFVGRSHASSRFTTEGKVHTTNACSSRKMTLSILSSAAPPATSQQSSREQTSITLRGV